MVSILIPVYQDFISELVAELIKQAEILGLEYEILCYDDASMDQFKNENRKLAQNAHIKYKELELNIGRSKIRNLMAKEAHYENLIYLDSDSIVCNPNFIQNYLKELNQNERNVIHGGRVYSDNRPDDDFSLHWSYGKHFESQNAATRKENSPKYFHSNNFLVKKKVVLRIPFNEQISGYGYEDLVWAKQLETEGFIIEYIDNEVVHNKLDTNLFFIQKTKTGLDNLYTLYSEGNNLNTPLVKLALFFYKSKFSLFYNFIFSIFSKKIYKNLCSGNSSLFLFQMYKLDYLIRLFSKK